MYNSLSEDKVLTLKAILSQEKVNLIEKFHLSPNKNHIWYTQKEGAYPRKYFKQSFAERNDILALLFRVYELCGAKLKYYRENIEKYEPYFYDFEAGFVSTMLWNAEFLKHRASGCYIDLRTLQGITEIEKFNEFCAYFEKFEV